MPDKISLSGLASRRCLGALPAAAVAADEALAPAPEATPLPPGIAPIFQPFKGDLDGMVKRRVIRVLTVQNQLLYFVDRGREVGITQVARLRRQAAAEGLDPNKWFSNVELIAAKRIGRETVTYVSNIYKYHLAYRMMMHQYDARRQAKATVTKR